MQHTTDKCSHLSYKLTMNRTFYQLLLAANLTELFITPANADVSYEGYYVALTFILGVLLLPVVLVALSHRNRKKQYLTALIVWAVAAFAYLCFTGGKQNEFFLFSSVSYIILAVYFIKEKKSA